MKRIAPFAILVLPFLTGCGPLLQAFSGGGAHKPQQAQGPIITDDQKAAVRTQEDAGDKAMAAMGDPEKQQTDKAEQDVVSALKFSLGQQPAMPNMPPPESASATVTALRKANIKLRIEPVTDQNGKAVADNFLQVKDSYTDRVMQLSRKMADGSATPAERKEVTTNAKYAMRLNDLKMQLGNISRAAMMANSNARTSALTTMLRIAGMVKTRKQYEMEMNDADYAKVKGWLTRQHRIEAIAATSLAVLAVYQAVLNDGGNPQAIDELATNALKGFPLDIQATDDEAKAYVTGLDGNIQAVKQEYEATMRKRFGDAVYEAQYKAGTDAMFRQADPSSTKTISQIVGDTNAKYKEDLAKCGRGEPISPGSMVGPARCKEAREAVQNGQPIPDTLGGGSSDDSSSGGGLLGALKGFPGFGIISATIDGVQAIAKGDARGALRAAASIVPALPGGNYLKMGLDAADKVLAIKDKVDQTKQKIDNAVQTNGASLVPGHASIPSKLPGKKG